MTHRLTTAAARHGRACPDHPRLRQPSAVFKTWMLATRASMTTEPSTPEMRP